MLEDDVQKFFIFLILVCLFRSTLPSDLLLGIGKVLLKYLLLMPQVFDLSQKVFNALMVCIIDFLHIAVLAEAVDVFEAVTRAPPVQIGELLSSRVLPRVIAPVALVLILLSVLIDVIYNFSVAHSLRTFFDGFGACLGSALVLGA